MIDRDRVGCPQCRAKLVRTLREPWSEPGWGPQPRARHYGSEYLAAAALAAAVLGTAVSAYGQYQAGQQAQAAAQYNAMLAEQQGAYQLGLAQFEAGMMQRQALGLTALAEAEAAFGIQSAQAQAAASIDAAEAASNVRDAAIRRAYERTQSDVRAVIGKSGVDTTGSPLMVLLENADTVGQELALNEYQTALDVSQAKVGIYSAESQGVLTRTNAQLRADALTHQATYARFGGSVALAGAMGQAGMDRFGGQSAGRAAMWNVGSTLLSGASAAASPYLRYGSATDAPRPGGYNTGKPAFG
jgi:hypothetical protein